MLSKMCFKNELCRYSTRHLVKEHKYQDLSFDHHNTFELISIRFYFILKKYIFCKEPFILG